MGPDTTALCQALVREFGGAERARVERMVQVAGDLWRFRFRWWEADGAQQAELAVRLGAAGDTQREARAMEAARAAELTVPTVWLAEPRVFDWLDGERFGNAWRRRRAEATPQLLAELLVGLHERTERPTGRDSLKGRLTALRDRARAAGDEEAMAELVELGQARPDAGTTALCHGGYRPENVILARGEPAVVGWSRAGIGDPRLDLAIATRRLGEEYGGALRTPFLRAYRGTRPTPPDELAWFERLAGVAGRIEP